MYENTLSGLIYNNKALEVVLNIKDFVCLTQIMFDLFHFYRLPKNSTFQPCLDQPGKERRRSDMAAPNDKYNLPSTYFPAIVSPCLGLRIWGADLVRNETASYLKSILR